VERCISNALKTKEKKTFLRYDAALCFAAKADYDSAALTS
jgi:hypothetical protein